MGFCAQCGEVMSGSSCKACGSTTSVNPLTGESGSTNSASDAYIPAGFEEQFFGSMKIEAPPPHAEPQAFFRGTTKCCACTKTIGGEALALDDGRICHSTCL
eukprot:3814609-Prymnesium_polylepis.1